GVLLREQPLDRVAHGMAEVERPAGIDGVGHLVAREVGEAGAEEREERERGRAGVVVAVAGAGAGLLHAPGGEGRRAPRAVGRLVAREPAERRADRVLRPGPAAAAGDQVLAAAEPRAVAAGAAAAGAYPHRVHDPRVPLGLPSAEAAGVAGRVGEEAFRLALHLAVVLVVGALVAVRQLRLGEEDRRLVQRR